MPLLAEFWHFMAATCPWGQIFDELSESTLTIREFFLDHEWFLENCLKKYHIESCFSQRLSLLFLTKVMPTGLYAQDSDLKAEEAMHIWLGDT